ncbi:MAG TPA: ATP-binding protein [Haliangium sp.]|nr:ATP-binding protein [Haliangium sp.]
MFEQRIRWANFEHSRMLAGIDFHFNPQLPKSRIIDLATAGFVVQRRSVLLLGPSGVGKSHIAQALGQRACRLGHKVLLVTVHVHGMEDGRPEEGAICPSIAALEAGVRAESISSFGIHIA